MRADTTVERRTTRTRTPFGQAACEQELKSLKDGYSKLYFDESPFNSAALDDDMYIIIGRRGSAKTALSQYFSFQKVLPDPIYIDVDEPETYQGVLENIAGRASELREIAIPKLAKLGGPVDSFPAGSRHFEGRFEGCRQRS